MTEKQILIVDDEKDLRDALHTALAAEGYTILEADNGAEGLALALKYKPDLILLDIMMPKMNGHETLQKLRLDAWGKDVPVLLLTNSDDAANIAHGVELKSDDYIIKSQESLASIVKKVKQHILGYHD